MALIVAPLTKRTLAESPPTEKEGRLRRGAERADEGDLRWSYLVPASLMAPMVERAVKRYLV